MYIGVTSNITQRINTHKLKLIPGFSAKYNCTKLVHLEMFDHIKEAIAREKQLKNWHREWKFNLIKSVNPLFEEIQTYI